MEILKHADIDLKKVKMQSHWTSHIVGQPVLVTTSNVSVTILPPFKGYGIIFKRC